MEPRHARHPETAAHLLGIHDGNRAERLRAFPRAVRRELVRPVVLPDPDPRAAHRLLAVHAATGLVAGMSSLTPGNGGAIGIQLAPDFRGRGLGTELVEATARLGHEHLGLESVSAGTETSNHRCRGALEAAGFVECEGPALHAPRRQGRRLRLVRARIGRYRPLRRGTGGRRHPGVSGEGPRVRKPRTTGWPSRC